MHNIQTICLLEKSSHHHLSNHRVLALLTQIFKRGRGKRVLKRLIYCRSFIKLRIKRFFLSSSARSFLRLVFSHILMITDE